MVFKPIDYIKAITLDESLTHRDKVFLTNVVLHTDNGTGVVRCSVEQVAKEVGIEKSNAYKMMKSGRYNHYLVVTATTRARYTKWSWQPLEVVTTTPTVVTTTTNSGRDNPPSTLIYKESTNTSTNEAPAEPVTNQEKETENALPLPWPSRSDNKSIKEMPVQYQHIQRFAPVDTDAISEINKEFAELMEVSA